MRILIVAVYYLPTHNSCAKLIHDLGVEFLHQNHEVTVLTTSDTISHSSQVTVEDGLRIIRVKTGKIKGAAKVFRAFHEARLSSTMWRQSKQFLLANSADVIITWSPSIFFGALVSRLKSLWDCPAYLIQRDIFPQWAVDAGLLKKGLIWRFFRRKEVEQYEAADVIGVGTPSDLKYFDREFSHRRYPLEVLHNWTALNEPNLPSTNYRGKLGLQNKVVFFYGGNLGAAQDVDNMLRLAANLLEYADIYFLLVGDGTEVPRLKSSIEARCLSNIQVLPGVDQPEYLAMVSEFDIGLCSLDRRLTTHNMPGKLLSYMYWGIPTLASINTGNDLFQIMEENQAGICITNGDDQSLKVAALQLANDADLRKRMGKNARKLLEQTFSVSAAARQIMGHFTGVERAGIKVQSTTVLPVLGGQAGQ